MGDVVGWCIERCCSVMWCDVVWCGVCVYAGRGLSELDHVCVILLVVNVITRFYWRPVTKLSSVSLVGRQKEINMKDMVNACECVNEWVSERASEQASEWVGERVTERVCLCVHTCVYVCVCVCVSVGDWVWIGSRLRQIGGSDVIDFIEGQ